MADLYDPETARTIYSPEDSTALARLWSREKILKDLADLGFLEYFEGVGDNPTGLSGYSTGKLWLRPSAAGVTEEAGTIRVWNGGTASLLASWPELTRSTAATYLIEGATAALALKANLASPTFTGVPAAPTAAPGTNTTQVATTAFVVAESASAATTAVNAVIASAPGALNTLDELAAALGDDANYATTVTNALALKAPLASPAFTGTPTAPTLIVGTATTAVANAAFVANELALKANLASPTFTGQVITPDIRINKAFAFGAVAQTHYFELNINGTTFKIMCGT